MDILKAFRETASADYVIFIGVVQREGDSVRISPPDQPDVYGVLPVDALVEEPQPLGAGAPDPFTATNLSVIKLRRGIKVDAVYKGASRTLTIPDKDDGESRTIAIGPSLLADTYCIVAGEFRCDNDQFIGPCVGVWTCGK